MRDLAIDFNGRQYTYAGYRYDKLSDALHHAQLVRVRHPPPSGVSLLGPAARP